MIRTRDNRNFSSLGARGRRSYPVVRVLTPWPGGRSAHLVGALKAYLARPGQPLPPDPGPGSYPIAARLDPGQIAKAMIWAKESNRAAFVRRVLLWKYSPKPIGAPAKSSVTSVKLSQAVAPKPQMVPTAPPRNKDDGPRSELGVPPSLESGR